MKLTYPNLHDVRVVIPTLNAEGHFGELLPALGAQGLAPNQVLILDSSSTDKTRELALAFGAQVHVIPREEFDHGTTRTLAATMLSNAEYLIYLTQDAVPAHSGSFAAIIAEFADEKVGMAFGRQLPRKSASAIEAHARIFNYPPKSSLRTFSDRHRLGIKTVFCSNSFAAYRYRDLAHVGFFPSPSYFAEDQIVASRILLADRVVAYSAKATVYHSHNYSISQEFKRYFDIGVFHSQNRWLIELFGRPEGEGLRYIKSEIAYLWHHEPLSIPSALTRAAGKYAGYNLGLLEANLSVSSKMRLSAQPSYWKHR